MVLLHDLNEPYPCRKNDDPTQSSLDKQPLLLPLPDSLCQYDTLDACSFDFEVVQPSASKKKKMECRDWKPRSILAAFLPKKGESSGIVDLCSSGSSAPSQKRKRDVIFAEAENDHLVLTLAPPVVSPDKNGKAKRTKIITRRKRPLKPDFFKQFIISPNKDKKDKEEIERGDSHQVAAEATERPLQLHEGSILEL